MHDKFFLDCFNDPEKICYFEVGAGPKIYENYAFCR